MFVYEKKLQYPVRIANPNPKLAALTSAVLLSIASAYRVPVAINLPAVLACAIGLNLRKRIPGLKA